MKKIILFLFTITISYSVFSQNGCNGRYESEIFSSVTVTEVNYSDVYSDNEHKMDIYTPDGDTEVNRPLILFMHGGSFTGGSKELIDCVDFCESFAKRGYVTASVNYRLASNPINFMLDQELQYRTVFKSIADIKSAIRYFRKDYNNGNTYSIDDNTIFIGGSSAGGVIAVNLAYVDDISDLPTSPIDVQSIANSLGGLEGDAGNDGYSSQVSGVISFAGGINDVNWIDNLDEPLVSIQGDLDETVNYNCGPGLNLPSVLTLCGSGEMHPQADAVGLINNVLVYPGEAHTWFVAGNSNSKFTQAVEFTKDFLYPLLPCNNATSITSINSEKTLIKITDLLGRETEKTINTPLFYIYSNGEVEKKIFIN
ncbi:MAG TPA: alpha/beta hydrolase [Flavobacteriales bacterium]|nr:alpha/beta hydrolase [Flavobacteriales bacterium]